MASRSHKEFLSILISLCGADANQRDGNGCTALFFIVTLGYAECMEKLLSCGGLTDAVRCQVRAEGPGAVVAGALWGQGG